MYEIINCTPHTVTYADVAGPMEFPPSGVVPRVEMREEWTLDLMVAGQRGRAIRHCIRKPGKVEGLPDERDGVLLIVSSIVMSACPERMDLIAPHQLIRDGEGKVLGCGAFCSENDGTAVDAMIG